MNFQFSKIIRIGIITFLLSINIVAFQNCGSGLQTEYASTMFSSGNSSNGNSGPNTDIPAPEEKKDINFDLRIVNMNSAEKIYAGDTGFIELMGNDIYQVHADGHLFVELGSDKCSLDQILLQFSCSEKIDSLRVSLSVDSSPRFKGNTSIYVNIYEALPTDINYSLQLSSSTTSNLVSQGNIIAGAVYTITPSILNSELSINDYNFFLSNSTCRFHNSIKNQFVCSTPLSGLSVISEIKPGLAYTGSEQISNINVIKVVDDFDFNLLSPPLESGKEMFVVFSSYTQNDNINITLSGNSSCALIKESNKNKVICSEAGNLTIKASIKESSNYVGVAQKSFMITAPVVIPDPVTTYQVFYSKKPGLSQDTTPFCSNDVVIGQACDYDPKIPLCRRTDDPAYVTFQTYKYIGCYDNAKKEIEITTSGVRNLIKGAEPVSLTITNEAGLIFPEDFDTLYKSVNTCNVNIKEVSGYKIPMISCDANTTATELEIILRVKDSIPMIKGEHTVKYTIEAPDAPKKTLTMMTLIKTPVNFFIPSYVKKGGAATNFVVMNDGKLFAHDFEYTLDNPYCTLTKTQAKPYDKYIDVVAISCNGNAPGTHLNVSFKVKDSIETVKGEVTQKIQLKE